jgi:hypothetical protein
MVTVTAGRGAESQTFKIYKETLCYHSPFFATAFNGSFLEGQTQVMELDDVEGTTFGLLVAWLYTKTISDQDLAIEGQTEAKNPTPSSDAAANLSAFETKLNAQLNLLNSDEQAKFMAGLKALSVRDPEPGSSLNALHLAKLWVLGQRFLIPDLQNCALAKMHSVLASDIEGGHPQLKEIAEYAYSGEYNELRMLVIEILAFVDTQCPLEEFPKQILVDTTKRLRAHCSSYGMRQAEYFFVEGGTETTVVDDEDLGWSNVPPSSAWGCPVPT